MVQISSAHVRLVVVLAGPHSSFTRGYSLGTRLCQYETQVSFSVVIITLLISFKKYIYIYYYFLFVIFFNDVKFEVIIMQL